MEPSLKNGMGSERFYQCDSRCPAVGRTTTIVKSSRAYKYTIAGHDVDEKNGRPSSSSAFNDKRQCRRCSHSGSKQHRSESWPRSIGAATLTGAASHTFTPVAVRGWRPHQRAHWGEQQAAQTLSPPWQAFRVTLRRSRKILLASHPNAVINDGQSCQT